MKKVEIIKIPYKPFRKKLYEDYSKILRKSLIMFSEKSCGNPKGGGEMKEIPYRLYRKILYEF